MSYSMAEHEKIIVSFLQFINKNSNDFILKGGTALKQCYNLNRFSEDIDFDVKNKANLIDFVQLYCDKNHFSFRVGKNTDTVQRCFINYGTNEKPLKVEASYRNRIISNDDIKSINSITVYSINRLAQMKANAYASRDKIRDLYDLSFICNHFYSNLSSQTINILSDAVGNKGIEQFDYLLSTQYDPLIDKDKLASDFLSMNEKLGLLYSNEERNNCTDKTKIILEKNMLEYKKENKESVSLKPKKQNNVIFNNKNGYNDGM